MVDKIINQLSWYLFLGIMTIICFVLAASGYYGLLAIFALSIAINYGIQILILKYLTKSLIEKGKKIEDIPTNIADCWDMYTIKKEIVIEEKEEEKV